MHPFAERTSCSPWIIGSCDVEERATALRLIGDGLNATLRDGLASAISAALRDEVFATSWKGLFIARDAQSRRPCGAVWVQLQPGNTAIVWPPAIECEAALELLCTAAEFSDREAIGFVQWSVGADQTVCDATWQQAGFARFVELLYLVASTDAASASAPTETLDFEPYAERNHERLRKALAATYVGSLDCPQLDSKRPLDEVLAGYRAQGRFMPDQWYLIQAHGRDVGVLLMADHAAQANWELIYMGLAPEVRGLGFGRLVADFALQRAAAGGAEHMVLAVDARNTPAISAYAQAGFSTWDRQTVYARIPSDSLST